MARRRTARRDSDRGGQIRVARVENGGRTATISRSRFLPGYLVKGPDYADTAETRAEADRLANKMVGLGGTAVHAETGGLPQAIIGIGIIVVGMHLIARLTTPPSGG